MSEYRPVPRERAEEFVAFLRYAFNPQAGPPDGEDIEVDDDRWAMGEPVGMFDDAETLLSTARHYYWPIRIRGEFHPAAGLSAVATPPEHRHRGFVRELLQASLEAYRERDVVLATLWPFSHPFYASYGWRVGSALQQVTFEPAVLADAVPERAGTVRRLALEGGGSERTADQDDDPDDPAGFTDPAVHPVDVDDLNAVYRKRVAPYDLVVDRDEAWWRHQVLHGWDAEPYCYGWFDETDTLRAHVVYVFEEPDDVDGRRLRVWEHAATDDAAWGQLLRFYHGHASQVADVRLYDTLDAPWRDLGEDPQAFDVAIRPGVMVRLVDVARALEAIEYPPDATAGPVLDVEDDHAPWNDMRLGLDVADGVGRVETDVDGDPDVTVDVGTLTQLVVGYRPAPSLARTGRLRAESAGVLDTLETCFPPRDLSMPTGF